MTYPIVGLLRVQSRPEGSTAPILASVVHPIRTRTSYNVGTRRPGLIDLDRRQQIRVNLFD